jgi:hypothetical protein
MSFEEECLFPFLLGEVSDLDIKGIETYDHGIVWTKRYPRKLDGEDWICGASERLKEFSKGKAYIQEMLNPSIKLNITGYPSGGILSFMVVTAAEKTEYYYNPASEQKFHRI